MNKKGFTMIELMATITLLGIMLTLAVVSVSKYLNKARNTAYRDYEKTLEGAATNYFLDHTGLLPEKGDATGTTITANDLINGGYLTSMKDPKKKNATCDNGSFVKVIRKEDVGFNMDIEYKTCVVCGNYKSKGCSTASCQISITNGSKSGSDWWTSKSVDYKLIPSGDYSSYGVSTSKYELNNNLTGSVTGDGTHTIYGTVKDKNTNFEMNCSTQIKIDSTPPICTYIGGNSKWTANNVHITRICSDNLSGCQYRGIGIYVPLKSGKTYTVPAATVRDLAGNKTSCPTPTLNVYIDRVAPTISSSVVQNYIGNLCPNNSSHVFKYRYDVTLADADSGLKRTSCNFGGAVVSRNISGTSKNDIALKNSSKSFVERWCTDVPITVTCQACDQAGKCYSKKTN